MICSTLSRGLALAGCVAAMAATSSTPRTAVAPAPRQISLSEAQRAQARTLVEAVDQAMDGKETPAAFAMRWHHEFRRAPDGQTYVPFTIALPAGSDVRTLAIYTRVVAATAEPPSGGGAGSPGAPMEENKAEGPEFAFEDLHFASPGSKVPALVHRAFIVPPGDYTVYIALAEREQKTPADEPPRITVHREALTVPDYGTNALNTSSVILADEIDQLRAPLTPEQQLERPYTIGNVAITPSIDGAFTTADLLRIVFVIYNAAPDRANKPDVSVEYGFYRTGDGQEVFFNKTAPQLLNPQTLPKEFDLSAGHLLVARQNLPLGQFPLGSYRLEVTVTDHGSGQTIQRSAGFSVGP